MWRRLAESGVGFLGGKTRAACAAEQAQSVRAFARARNLPVDSAPTSSPAHAAGELTAAAAADLTGLVLSRVPKLNGAEQFGRRALFI